MPAATYSAPPQEGPRGKCSAKRPPQTGVHLQDCKKVGRKEEGGCWICRDSPLLRSRQPGTRLTRKQAAYHHIPQSHRDWGNAEGVRGLLLSQGHRQAPFSNARAAQRSQFSSHRPSISGSVAKSAAFEKG